MTNPNDTARGEGLKPCPLCNAQMETDEYGDFTHPYNGCLIEGSAWDVAFADKWNTRTPPAAPTAPAGDLVEATVLAKMSELKARCTKEDWATICEYVQAERELSADALTSMQERIAELTEQLRITRIEADDMRATSIKNARERNAAEALVKVQGEALEPFGTEFAKTFVDDDGWKGPMNQERIVDWFGPSDFRRAQAAYEGGGHGKHT